MITKRTLLSILAGLPFIGMVFAQPSPEPPLIAVADPVVGPSQWGGALLDTYVDRRFKAIDDRVVERIARALLYVDNPAIDPDGTHYTALGDRPNWCYYKNRAGTVAWRLGLVEVDQGGRT